VPQNRLLIFGFRVLKKPLCEDGIRLGIELQTDLELRSSHAAAVGHRAWHGVGIGIGKNQLYILLGLKRLIA
jgi:hypothetical protein